MSTTDSTFTIKIGSNVADALRGNDEVRKSLEKTASVAAELNGSLALQPSLLEKAAAASTAIRNGFSVAAEAASRLSEPFRQSFRFDAAATRLAPLVGGLERSRALAERLRKEGARGTLEFEQLAGVAGKLASVFSSTAAVEKWTSAFHNLAAGTGTDVNSLVDNFVKSKASGRFEAGFMDMFAQKGINLFPELERQTGKTSAELRKLAAEGKLAWSEVEKAILAVSTGTGQFADAAAKASGTAGGSVQSLVAEWEILQAKLAEPIAEALTPLLQKAAAALDAAAPSVELFGNAIAAAGKITATLAGNWAVQMVAAGVAARKLFALAGPAIASVSARFLSLRRSVVYSLLPLRSFGMLVRAQHGSVIAFAGKLLVLDKAALATAKTLRFVFPAAVRAAKAALVSTLIGGAVVLAGEALAWLYEKLFAFDEAAEDFRRASEEIEDAAEDLEKRFRRAADAASLDALKEEVEEEREAWQERLDAIEEGSDEYREFSEKFEAWKNEAAEQSLAAEKRIEAQKLAERNSAAAAELAQMRERSDKLRAEIEREKREMLLAASGTQQKMQFLLSFAKVGSVKELEAELAALESALELTEEQARRADELLDAKKQILAVEKEAESVRAGLREKIALMQAELQGNEALLALKEKIHRNELREQISKALPGASPEQIAEQVDKYLELEKAVEKKRLEEQAAVALQKEAVELERKRLKEAGDEAALKKFNAEIAAREKFNELVKKGVEETQALAVAQRHLRFDLGDEGADKKLEPLGRASLPEAVPAAAPGNAFGVFPSVAAGGLPRVDSALIEISKAVRDNTRGILEHLRAQKPKSIAAGAVLA